MKQEPSSACCGLTIHLREKSLVPRLKSIECLGRGLLEGAYGQCLAVELVHRGLEVERQVVLPLMYHGVRIDHAFRVDMIVSKLVVVEVKAVEAVLPVHELQMLTHVKPTKLRVGRTLNFHAPLMTTGITQRVV
jgi:GxxExxY protein